MSESTWISIAADRFFEYVGEEMADEELRKCESVEELIYHWLTRGKAVEDCRCDFRIFLSAVAYIFAIWHDTRCVNGDETSIPASITQARSDPKSAIYGNILDPYEFVSALAELRYQEHYR